MNEFYVNEGMLREFEGYMHDDEKSKATIEKYIRDVKRFMAFAGGRELAKSLIIEYKESLSGIYAVSSANSMIAALNYFLRYCGLDSYCVKQFKVQSRIYCSEQRELTRAEYMRLVNAAGRKKSRRTELLLQTICGTGIRVSELKFITVEAVCRGEATVSCKRKTRTVFIPYKLQKKLRYYCRERGITSGAVFVTRTGKPLNRCSVWREMKALCRDACVSPDKVFPHNLRHLFARTFYGIERDVAKLADLLGHSSLNTTRIYIMETGKQHRRKIEKMKLII